MRLLRIALLALGLWVATAIGSTHQGPRVDCYQGAKWDGIEWQYTGVWYCLGD